MIELNIINANKALVACRHFHCHRVIILTSITINITLNIIVIILIFRYLGPCYNNHHDQHHHDPYHL